MKSRSGFRRLASAAFMVSLSVPLFGSGTWRWALPVSCLLLLPILREVRNDRWLTRLSILGVVSCVIAIVWAQISTYDGREIDRSLGLSQSLTFLAPILVAGATLVALRSLSPRVVVSVWAVGSLALASSSSGRFGENPWKYGLALPLSLLLLVVCGALGRSATFVAAIGLVAVSAYFSFRGWILIVSLVVLALVVASLMRKKRVASAKSHRIAMLAGAGVIGIGIYVVASQIGRLALKGSLGLYAQERSIMSLQATGNALIGSRAEWGAAVALFGDGPNGLGLGVVPNGTDTLTAVEGMLMPEVLKPLSNVAISFSNGRPEFHSALWNVWASFGLLGLCVMLIIFIIISLSIVQTIVLKPFKQSLEAPLLVLHFAALWGLLFSPTDPWLLGLSLGVAASTLKPHFVSSGLAYAR